MKKILIIFFLFNVAQLFAVWDLTVSTLGDTMDFEMKLVSIPFEGYNRVDTVNYNRLYDIYNGGVHRRFCNATTFRDSQIVYHHRVMFGTFYLASCFSESSCYSYSRWGFGKYLITLKLLNDTSKTIRFYLNSLDSKAGIDTVSGYGYHADWSIKYYKNNGNPYVVFGRDNPLTTDTVWYNNQFKEIKLWEFMYGRSTPLEKNFKARTTPFGINRQFAAKQCNVLSLGTKVVMDTVWRNKDAVGVFDQYGFNTQNDVYYDAPSIPSGLNRAGDTYTTPGITVYDNELDIWKTQKFVGTNGDTLIMKKRKILWVIGSIGLGDTVLFKQGSTLVKENEAEIRTFNGGVFVDSGANSVWSTGSGIRSHRDGAVTFAGNGSNILINNGAYVQIDSSAFFNVGSNTTVTFDGTNTSLTLKKGAIVTLGTNSKLVFKNGAKIDAQNVTFNCGSIWKGIVLENSSGNSIIKNCTFNNAENSIKIINSSMVTMATVIENNIINVPNTGYYWGIYCENISGITIQNNTFNILNTARGMYLKNTVASQTEGSPNPAVEAVAINILNNKFLGGSVSLILASYLNTANTAVFVQGNEFNSSYAIYNIVTKQIGGTIKNCKFNNSATERNVLLTESSIAFYGDTMQAKYANVYCAVNSTARLGPNTHEVNSEMVSVIDAGFNKFTTVNTTGAELIGNLQSNPGCNFLTDYGNNRFTIGTVNNNNFHYYGYIQSYDTIYNSRLNCFSHSAPTAVLKNLNNQTMTVYATLCTGGTPSQLSTDVIHYAPNVSDSIPVTTAFSDSNAQDALLYGQAFDQYDNAEYLDGIITCKNLINSYPSSSFAIDAIGKMYDCYIGLDTLPATETEELLFGDLKVYLEEKIVSGDYTQEFEDAAYNYTLMCLIILGDKWEALDGYDLIAMYHPDPEARLLASWDAEELEDLLNGAGGVKENSSRMKSYGKKALNIRKNEILRLKEINSTGLITNVSDLKKLQLITEFETKEPVKDILKNNFQKRVKQNEKIENESNTSKILNSKKVNAPTKKDYEKVARLQGQIKNVMKENKANLQLEHLLTFGNSDNESENAGAIVAKEYSLSQNYPNPFNPTTSIKYSLPKAGFVSVKIYDVVGRMVKELVSEVKETGNYSITFDGSQFASGVYFYRLETNNFVDTKRMVLVK